MFVRHRGRRRPSRSPRGRRCPARPCSSRPPRPRDRRRHHHASRCARPAGEPPSRAQLASASGRQLERRRGSGRGRRPSARPARPGAGRRPSCQPQPAIRLQHGRVVGDHADRHVVAGVLGRRRRCPAGGRRGRPARGSGRRRSVEERGERVAGSTRRTRRRRRLTASGSRQTSVALLALLGHPVEDRAVADLVPRSTMRGSGAHGWWLEIRSISAITGGRSGRRELAAAERLEGVLVGHRRVAEPRPLVADVARVVELVEVVEALALGPVLGVGRDVDDGAPAGLPERAGQREPVARRAAGRSVRWLSTQSPDCRRRVRQPARRAERRRGEERAARVVPGRRQPPGALRRATCAIPARSTTCPAPPPARSSRRRRAARPCRAARRAGLRVAAARRRTGRRRSRRTNSRRSARSARTSCTSSTVSDAALVEATGAPLDRLHAGREAEHPARTRTPGRGQREPAVAAATLTRRSIARRYADQHRQRAPDRPAPRPPAPSRRRSSHRAPRRRDRGRTSPRPGRSRGRRPC